MTSQGRPDHVWVQEVPDRFAFRYEAGKAFVEGVALEDIAAAVGTPTYVYSAAHIASRYRALEAAVSGRPTKICYAVKSNGSLAVLRHLQRLGSGADIVSVGEMKRAMAAGISPSQIVFSGVGKADDELDAAIEVGLRSINAESSEEVDRIEARAKAVGKTANVTLRVNPDVDPKTHPYLATGLREAKFGISMEEASTLARHVHATQGLRMEGIGCHIGSQISDVTPFLHSFHRLRDLAQGLKEDGVSLGHIDLGGGFGIAYSESESELDIAAWGRAVMDASAGLDVELMIEPGRYLTGQAGVLLTRVVGNKQSPTKGFLIIDAAMNDLIRPALYQAYHAIVPVTRAAADAEVSTVDVVGPVCESGDFLGLERAMPACSTGSLLGVLSAGAYGMSMASNYNTRPLPAEVWVEGDRFAVTRPRQTVEELLAVEQVPEWA
ncbi:MAG: diaminopimelate decarboxylase [Nannocystaceae bacterium]|nr:diaminopimelate decarboxylase [Nannocystaceae bacterium]